MANLKLPSTALQRIFMHSIYDLYYFEPENPLRLVYETLSFAILATYKTLFIFNNLKYLTIL
jgi:hypothetical protein